MANENVVDQIWSEIFQSSQGNVYILVTWCPIISAWLPTKKGVWFTPWLTDKKFFTYFLHFTLSDAILKSERGRILCLFKDVLYLGVDKNTWTQPPCTLFRAGVWGLSLVLWHRHCAWILDWVLQKKVCSHWCPVNTVLMYSAWILSRVLYSSTKYERCLSY